MLDEAEMARVAKHETVHRIGYCTCPCFDALMKVGAALKDENALRVRLAKASPELLAGLTIGAAMVDEANAEEAVPDGEDAMEVIRWVERHEERHEEDTDAG